MSINPAPYLTVVVDPDAGLALQQQRPPTEASEEIRRTADRLHVELRPTFPGVQEPSMARFFQVFVEDSDMAKSVAAELLKCRGVESASAKPAVGLPWQR